MSDDAPLIRASREDIEWLAAVLAQPSAQGPQAPVITIDMLDMLSLDAMASAVAGITDPIGQLKDWLYGVLQNFINVIVDSVSAIVRDFYERIIKPGLDAIASAVSSGFSYVTSWLQAITETLAEIANTIRNVVIDPIIDAVKWVADNLPRLASAIEDAISRISDAASRLVAKLQSMAESIASILSDLTAKLSDVISTVAERLSGVVETLKTTISAVADTISSLVGSVANALDSLLGRVRDVVAEIVDRLSAAASTVADALSSIVSSIADRLRSAVESIESALTSLVDAIVGKLQAIPSVLESLVEWLRGGIESLLDTLRGAVDRIASTLSKIPEYVTDLLDRVASAASTIIDSVRSAVERLVSSIQNYISVIVDSLRAVPEAIQSIISRILDSLYSVMDTIRGMFTSLVDAVQQLRASLESLLVSLADSLRGLFAGLEDAASRVLDAIRAIPDEIATAIRSVIDSLVEATRGAFEQLSSIVSRVVDEIKQVPGIVSEALQRLTEGASRMVEYIAKVVAALSPLFAPVTIAETLSDLIARAAPDVAEELAAVFQSIKSPLDFIREFPRIVWLTMKGIASAVWYLMPDSVKQFFENVANSVKLTANALTGFINAILKFPEWFPEWFREHIAEPIVGGLTSLKDAIAGLAESLRGFLEKVTQQVSAFLEDPVGQLKSWLSGLIDWLLGATEWLREHVVGPFISFVKGVWERVLDAVNWVVGKTVDVLKAVASFLYDAVYKAFSFIADVVAGVVKKVASAVRDATFAFARLYYDYLVPKPIKDLVEKIDVPEPYNKLLAGILPLGGPLAVVPAVFFKFFDMLKDALPSVLDNPFGFMYALTNVATMLLALSLVPVSAARALAKALGPMKQKIKLKLGIPGTGGETETEVEIKPGEFIDKLLREVSRVMPDVARYLIIGHMIWWAEPTRTITRYWLTNYLTIELPPMETSLRAVRRHLATPLAPSYYTMYVEQLRMGGIGQRFIDMLFPLPGKLLEKYAELAGFYDADTHSVVIKDRFGKDRLLPASLVAEIPTPSELASMMIRDIIQHPKYFAAAMAMHGFTPDAAFMFYLLHYKYPSPEKLAEFFWRGVAGELWNPDATVDRDVLRTFGINPDEWKAVAPRELNFKGKDLQKLLSQYMKWHDYARFPWQAGWPTDNAIITDLLADIPGKIDLRWMTRWGLFDYWGAYNIGIDTTIEEITRALLAPGQVTSAEPMYRFYLEQLVQPAVIMDVRQFARALQATGLHPYWVPWVTVAETINALVEERTLLRTGFINLYKEGLWRLAELNRLLSGFFSIVFRTGYYDFLEHEWKEVDIEYPVAFLPAESKLLELRALMDRALDIYREAYRYIARAMRIHLIDPKHAQLALLDIIKTINETFFKSEMKRIAGKELELVLDPGYWRAWEKYAEIVRDLEARERTRFYARYIIWSVLWGLRWGYTTREEAEEWLNRLVGTMNEHPIVKEAIQLSIDFMLNRFYKEIAVRGIINLLRSRRISVKQAIEELKRLGFDEETARLYINANVIWYTPALPTYASMLEVVPEALEMVLNVLDQFNIPQDEYQYWMLYYLRKPVQDELTLVRTRIYQLLALGETIDNIIEMLSRYHVSYRLRDGRLELEAAARAKELLAIYEKARDLFQDFGIAPQEWVLYNLVAEMEKRKAILRGELRERIPSPSTMAVIAEYLVLPEDLVRKTLEEYGVPEEWMNIWLEYIRVKPLKSDYKSLLAVYIRALRYGAVTRDELEEFLQELRRWGFTPKEIDLIRRRVELEEAIQEAREAARLYIPTPSMLATLAEYIEIPEDLVRKALEERRVPREWMALWLRYIKVRPLADEVRRLASAYFRAKRYGVPLGDLEQQILEILRAYGFTEMELRVRELEAAVLALVDTWREAMREYIPTPSMLATIAEYVPEARRLATKVLELRMVPREWWGIWLKYIWARPLWGEVREVLNNIRDLYEYFAVKLDDMRKALEQFVVYGLDREELELLVYASRLRASLRAYRELVGTPRQLVTLAEYSPRARRLALAQVYKMIDALPVDPQTKEFIKAMWEEYIRVRPVYDEVRRYVTELINDYAEGTISREELESELNALKDWGLDDYEIQFYLWLAERRRVRYMARYILETGYYWP